MRTSTTSLLLVALLGWSKASAVETWIQQAAIRAWGESECRLSEDFPAGAVHRGFRQVREGRSRTHPAEWSGIRFPGLPIATSRDVRPLSLTATGR
jgi:hypothetical protein